MVQYANQITSAPTNQVWITWTGTGSSTSTVNITSSSCWDQWCATSTTSGTSSITSSTVWINWVNGAAQVQIANPLAYQTVEQTPEQIAEAQRVAEARAKAHAEAEAKRKAAHAKAMELLRENLSQKQREALDKNGWFLVEGGKSGKTYKINNGGYAGNIHELDKDGRAIAKYCVHASYEFPLGDQLLTQALSLRLDEDHIIGQANRTALAA